MNKEKELPLVAYAVADGRARFDMSRALFLCTANSLEEAIGDLELFASDSVVVSYDPQGIREPEIVFDPQVSTNTLIDSNIEPENVSPTEAFNMLTEFNSETDSNIQDVSLETALEILESPPAEGSHIRIILLSDDFE